MAFTDEGLAVREAWRTDRDTLRLVAVPADQVECPDLSATANIGQGIGLLYAPERNGIIDITGPTPVPIPLFELGGSSDTAHGQLLVADDTDPAQRRYLMWLTLELGWDDRGVPFRRVLDEVDLGTMPTVDGSWPTVSMTCRTDDGRPVVAVVEPEGWDQPQRSWAVDLATEQFVRVDPSGVQCWIEGGD